MRADFFSISSNPEFPQHMDFEATFPLRYFINLGRRQDRRIETEIALDQAGVTAERFPAVDARFVRKTRGYESAGRYALALTQRLVLRTAALRKADAVLILEDDVVLHPRLLEKLAEIELPDDWGIFYLGCAHQKRPWPAREGIVRTPYALDTHAFAVRAPYYRKIMAALSRQDGEPRLHPRASDWFLADLHGEIPAYACHPNLAWQTVTASDLAGGTYSNYTPTGEQIAASGETIGLQAEMWGVARWQSWNRHDAGDPDGTSGGNISGPGATPVRRTDPKLGLLFLTRGDVNQPEIWRDFVSRAGEGVRVLSHPKNQLAAARGFLAGTAIPEWRETAWGDISLVRAMLDLLRNALADPSVTHFAFLSESCIPTRPWSEIRRRLTLDPRPMLDSQGSDRMKEKHLERISHVEDLPDRARRMHPQWMLLDREAATCVAEADLTRHFEGLEAPDEHYFGSVLALRGYSEDRIHRAPVTWVNWTENENGTHPKEHAVTDGALAAELAAFPGFFARKFPESSDIGRWGLHLP